MTHGRLLDLATLWAGHSRRAGREWGPPSAPVELLVDHGALATVHTFPRSRPGLVVRFAGPGGRKADDVIAERVATLHAGGEAKGEAKDEASKKALTVERPKFSTVDVYLSAFQLGEDHAKLFKTSIIDYVTEWYEIVTSRVKARTIEFTRLKANLLHYQKKVQGLDESTEKARRQAENTASKQPAPTDTSLRGMFNSMAMTRSDSTRNKLETQLDRNCLKLDGAREVFTMYGQSLILLIDEVVNRAWRDVLPVLLRSINLDMRST